MEKVIVQIRKINTQVEVDFDALPETSKCFVIDYGLKQLLNDAVASKDDKLEIADTVDRKLTALVDGSVRISSAGRASNPLAKAAMDYAREVVRASIRASGKQIKEYTTGQITEAAAKIVDNADVQKEAARRVKMQDKEASVSLADLGL